MNKEELTKLKLNELKELAKQAQIEIKGLKKDEIVQKLSLTTIGKDGKQIINNKSLKQTKILVKVYLKY